jgi:hypothetical protein
LGLPAQPDPDRGKMRACKQLTAEKAAITMGSKTNLQLREEQEPQKSSVLPGRFGRAYVTAFSDSKMAGSSKGEGSELADGSRSLSTTRSWAF